MNCLMAAWHQHEAEMRGWLRHRLGNAVDAEDLLQNVFLGAVRQGERFCAIANARARLYHVARNALADRLRLARSAVELPDDLSTDTEETAAVDSLAAFLPGNDCTRRLPHLRFRACRIGRKMIGLFSGSLAFSNDSLVVPSHPERVHRLARGEGLRPAQVWSISYLQQGACVTPAGERRDALRRARAIAFALLLGFCGAAPLAAEGFTIGGTGAALGTMQLLANEFRTRNPDILITIASSLGSHGSIKAMLDGAIGLAVTSRAMDERERKLGAVEIEYARTPFVFAVSAASALTAISTRELTDIYSGKMAAWPDGSPVRVLLRPDSDIDTEIVRNISPAMRQGVLAAESRPGVRFSVNDQDLANDLEKIEGAIGPSTLALIVSENRALRALKLDGREPTPMNAASGAYPYYKRLFLVTRGRRTAAVAGFIAFVQSPAGRKILIGNGHWIP